MEALTAEDLGTIFPNALKTGRVDVYITPLNATFDEFEINNPLRVAAFLSQIGVESAEMRYTHELGSDEYLNRYDTGKLAKNLGNTPEADGDGAKFKGRGLIEVTGQTNYRLCGRALNLDLINHPELLETPINACRSAGWYWRMRNINAAADAGDIERVTRLVNGGLNGYDERCAYYEAAKKTFGI